MVDLRKRAPVGRLSGIERGSLVRALAQARNELKKIDGMAGGRVGGMDLRGMGDVARLRAELAVQADEIELELRWRSLAENDAMIGLTEPRFPRMGLLTPTQHNVLNALASGMLVIRRVNSRWVVEAGEIGGERDNLKRVSHGTPGRVKDWRNNPRKTSVDRILRILTGRGLVWIDEYGYVVLSGPGLKAVTPKRKKS